MTDGPPLPSRQTMSQQWRDIAFLHWRVDPDRLERLLPDGVHPDVHDDSSWVGLIPFRMVDGALGRGRPVPYLGNFLETNVRLYSRDDEGRRGVVFLSLEAERSAIVVAANALLRIPYRWAAMDHRVEAGSDGVGPTHVYSSRRRSPWRRGPSTTIAVTVGDEIAAPSALDLFLTARFGLHTRVAGRTLWMPNTHQAWPLRSAEVAHLDDELVAAAGLDDLARARPPDSVRFSAGVATTFGLPRRLHPRR